MAAKSSSSMIKAVVSGATGATGQCLVPELLKSKSFSQVTVIGRRRYEIDAVFNVNQEAEEASGRLKQVLVNFDELNEENGKEHFEGADVYFCCLGTTRAKAGSAENFRKIDFDLVVKLATIARASNVYHLSLVSSQLASPSSFFLYLRTKGEADDAVMKMNFKVTSIWRPGALVRYGAGAFFRFMSRVTMGLPTEQLARAMRIDAEEKACAEESRGDEIKPPQIIGNSGIYAILRQEDARLRAESAAASGVASASASNEGAIAANTAEEAPAAVEGSDEQNPAATTSEQPTSLEPPVASAQEGGETSEAAEEPAKDADSPAEPAASTEPAATTEPAAPATEPATSAEPAASAGSATDEPAAPANEPAADEPVVATSEPGASPVEAQGESGEASAETPVQSNEAAPEEATQEE